MVINISDKYIFVHISKTAGNSVASRLKAYYPRKMFWLPKVEFGMHDTAAQIRDKIGTKRFESCYTFAFVRNPWDRLYSLYTFLCQKKMHTERGETWNQEELKRKGFKHWLMNDEWWPPYEQKGIDLPHQQRDQTSWVSDIEGNSIIDFIGKVEQLNDDFKEVCQNISLEYTPLPRVNPSKHSSYRDVYDSEMIKFVEEHHIRDIEGYGYEF